MSDGEYVCIIEETGEVRNLKIYLRCDEMPEKGHMERNRVFCYNRKRIVLCRLGCSFVGRRDILLNRKRNPVRHLCVCSLVLILFTACLTGRIVKADDLGAGTDFSIRVNVILGTDMGEEWNGIFCGAVSQTLSQETTDGSMDAVTCQNDSEFADALYYAGEGGSSGVIFCADVTDERVRNEIDELRRYGVQVVCLGDPVNNSYTIMDPEGYGRALTEALIDRVALYAGSEAWGNNTDFARHLLRRIRGIWETASSEGNRKQFIGYLVQEFSGSWDEPGNQVLKRVSQVYNMSDLSGTEAGYSYDLNTGNRYYLYTGSPEDYLECHFDEDGYSGSDSMMRPDLFFATEEGNSTYLLDTRSGTGESVTLTGTVSSFYGFYNETDSEECYALNLYSPVRVRTGDGTDIMLYAIQLNGGEELAAYADTGIRVSVEGTYWEAHTAHHYTPVLMDADYIQESSL